MQYYICTICNLKKKDRRLNKYLFYVLQAFLYTGLPRGEEARTGLIGPMQGAIPTQSRNL